MANSLGAAVPNTRGTLVAVWPRRRHAFQVPTCLARNCASAVGGMQPLFPATRRPPPTHVAARDGVPVEYAVTVHVVDDGGDAGEQGNRSEGDETAHHDVDHNCGGVLCPAHHHESEKDSER